MTQSGPVQKLERRAEERAKSRRQRRKENQESRTRAEQTKLHSKQLRSSRVLGDMMNTKDGRGFLFDLLRDWGYFDPIQQTDPVLLARATARRDCASEFANVISLQFPKLFVQMIEENRTQEVGDADYQEQRSKVNVSG